jgi:hypothetical protein
MGQYIGRNYFVYSVQRYRTIVSAYNTVHYMVLLYRFRTSVLHLAQEEETRDREAHRRAVDPAGAPVA